MVPRVGTHIIFWLHHKKGEQQPIRAVPAAAGDAIIFTEALTHGSLVNTSGRPRWPLYYCYSMGYMPDWGGQHLRFSNEIYEALPEQQREILRLK